QQLLVGGGPGDLLHLDFDVRMAGLELRHHLSHHLPLAAEPPETDGGMPARLPASAAGRREQREQGEGEPPQRGASASQPPVKPARFRPRTMWGFFRITFQTRPLRWFSIIATIGP